MSKKLWYGLAGLTATAAIATNVIKPDTQEFARTSTVTDEGGRLITDIVGVRYGN